VVGEFGAGGGGDHLVVDLDEERADEPDDTVASGPWTHPSTDARVVVARGRAIARPAVRGTLIGRTLARPTRRVDPSQQRRSLEAGAVSELQGIARFKFHDGKLEEFRRLSAQCMEIVRTKDTGTLQYDIYFNDDQSECIVLERYRDSEALIEHAAHLGDLTEAILATGSVSGELLGGPGAELRAKMADSEVRLFTPYQSM
jgi:quinol monooxygenase YgiN